MKASARSYVWWPKTDADLEQKVHQCCPFEENKESPPEAPLHPWEWPYKPWVRLHLDYACPFLGKMFLIVMDAHSKWMEAFPMDTSTSSATIEKRESLSRHTAYRKLSSQTMAATSRAKTLKISSNRTGSVTSEQHPITQRLTDWLRERYKLNIQGGNEEDEWRKCRDTSFTISSSLQNHPADFNRSVPGGITSRKETQIKTT